MLAPAEAASPPFAGAALAERDEGSSLSAGMAPSLLPAAGWSVVLCPASPALFWCSRMRETRSAFTPFVARPSSVRMVYEPQRRQLRLSLG